MKELKGVSVLTYKFRGILKVLVSKDHSYMALRYVELIGYSDVTDVKLSYFEKYEDNKD